MKQTKTKTLCLLLAALMLLSSLTACGKDKEKDSNLIQLGDYELLYKGACIMEDSDGNDAIVLSLDFTTARRMRRIFGASMKRSCRTAQSWKSLQSIPITIPLPP